MEPIRLRASEESKNQRLDAFLASSLDGLTRSQATRLIESGEVAVNGRAVSKSYKLAGGEDIAVTLPEPEPVEAVPQDIPLDVVYEDADVIVVNNAIHHYFEEYQDTEFIGGFNLTHCTVKQQLHKITHYHPFRDLPWKSIWWKNKLGADLSTLHEELNLSNT